MRGAGWWGGGGGSPSTPAGSTSSSHGPETSTLDSVVEWGAVTAPRGSRAQSIEGGSASTSARHLSTGSSGSGAAPRTGALSSSRQSPAPLSTAGNSGSNIATGSGAQPRKRSDAAAPSTSVAGGGGGGPAHPSSSSFPAAAESGTLASHDYTTSNDSSSSSSRSLGGRITPQPASPLYGPQIIDGVRLPHPDGGTDVTHEPAALAAAAAAAPPASFLVASRKPRDAKSLLSHFGSSFYLSRNNSHGANAANAAATTAVAAAAAAATHKYSHDASASASGGDYRPPSDGSSYPDYSSGSHTSSVLHGTPPMRIPSHSSSTATPAGYTRPHGRSITLDPAMIAAAHTAYVASSSAAASAASQQQQQQAAGGASSSGSRSSALKIEIVHHRGESFRGSNPRSIILCMHVFVRF